MPPRKSKRTKATTSPPDHDDTVDAKTVARWKHVRGQRGGLKDLLKMPLDVIREICLLLHPRDLLSLSRTTKSFYALLMQRSSAYLWKGSMKNVCGLPPCPEGWIEPSWISLVFTPPCTVCGTTKDTTVYWEFRIRFCVRCTKQMFIPCDQAAVILSPWQTREFKHIPRTAFVEAMVPRFRRLCYTSSHLLDVVQTLGTRFSMYEMRDRDKLDKLTGEYIEQAKLTREHAGLCHKWAQKEEHARTTKLERERFENVTSRLRKLGWGPEVDFLHGQEYNELAEHELVRVAKKLTDRVWQKIQSEVIQLMEDIRAERLEHEYTVMLTERWSVMKSVAKGLLDRYLSEHPEMLEYGLNIADLALTKEFREVMCAPEDEVVGSARFLALEGQMNTIVESWRSRIRKEVQELFVKHGIPTPRHGDPLDLVTTVFEDVRSSERSFFPRIVSHKALRSAKPEAGGDAYEEFVYGLDDVHCYETCSMLRPLPTNDAMREVIKLCGKDPDVASVQEMDALDLRLLDKYGRIRTWRGAVMASSDDNHHAYKLVDAEGTAKVKESEMCKLEQEKLWTCPKCETPQLPETRDVVLKHLSTEHGIELPDITDADLKINRALESSLLASWASGDCPPYKNFWARF